MRQTNDKMDHTSLHNPAQYDRSDSTELLSYARLAMSMVTDDPAPTTTSNTNKQLADAQRLLEARRRELTNHSERPKTAIPGVNVLPVKPPTQRPVLAKIQATAADIEPVQPQPTIRVYPDLTAIAHKRRRDAEARTYLLAQHADTTGRGNMATSELRGILSDIYGDRRIRQIIAGGAGIFWTISKAGDRVYLHNPARVIDTLGGGRMSTKPVLVNADDIRAGMHQYRASCVYGAFLAGRNHPGNPISQSAIRERIGIAESTQRTYRDASGVQSRRGILLLGHKPDDASEVYWQHGRGAFVFTDWLGRVGSKEQQYIARSIPATYKATAQTRTASGRYRKNQKRLSLSNFPGQGNNRIYFDTADAAGRAYSRRHESINYHITESLTIDATTSTRLAGASIYGALPGI